MYSEVTQREESSTKEAPIISMIISLQVDTNFAAVIFGSKDFTITQ
jgi:hypothetical protein